MNRSMVRAYTRRSTCPFCGGRLRRYHPRDERGRIQPMTSRCTQCHCDLWDTLTGAQPQPEGGSTMSTKKQPKKSGAGRTTIARTKGGFSHPVEEPVEKTRYEELVDEGVLRPVEGGLETDATTASEEIAPKQEKAEDLCTFAIRLTKQERDEIHAAAGKGGATKFVKAVVLAVARGDGKAIQEHIDRVLGIAS